MSITGKNIPEYLIYEMFEDRPIYYRNYKQFLKGKLNIEEIIGSSYLQSYIITQIVLMLGKHLSEEFVQLTNEIGLRLDKKNWRAADIAIYKKTDLKTVDLEDRLLNIPPKYIIEIDTKASLEGQNELGTYYIDKTDQLLAFGVEKIIWILTASKKVIIAERGKNWEIADWNKDFQLEGININIPKFLP